MHDMSANDTDAGPLTDGGTSGDLQRAWSDVSYTGYTDGGYLWGVWNGGDGTVLAVGDYGTVLRSTGGGAFAVDTSTKPAAPALLSISGATGASSPQLFVAGFGGALWKWGGTDLVGPSTWNADAPGTGSNLYAVWTAPDGMAFAAGNGVLLQRTPSGSNHWTTLTGGPGSDGMSESAYSIWGTSTGTGTYSVYAVGCQIGSGSLCAMGMIWHTDGSGTVTTETAGTSQALYGVWGSGANDIYAVGDTGIIIHSTGDGTWTKQNSGISEMKALEAVGGSGPDEVYVVGDVDAMGTIVLQKLDHTKDFWDRVTIPETNNRTLVAVSATTTDIYFVGQGGAILHK